MTTVVPPASERILYETEDGRTRIEGRFEGETVWLTHAVMTHHPKEIYAEGERSPEATLRCHRIVRTRASAPSRGRSSTAPRRAKRGRGKS